VWGVATLRAYEFRSDVQVWGHALHRGGGVPTGVCMSVCLCLCLCLSVCLCLSLYVFVVCVWT